MTTTSPSVTRSSSGTASPEHQSGMGRAVILLVVLAAVALSLFVPVREYLDQRSRLSALTAQTSQARTNIDALTAEKKRWDDPAYTVAQARQRLHLVMPGETAYLVVESDPVTTSKPAAPAPTPWYSQVWSKVTGLVGR